jgi:type III secretion protein Q
MLNRIYGHNQEKSFDANGYKYDLRWCYDVAGFTPQIILALSVGGYKGRIALERLGGICDTHNCDTLDSPFREAMLVQTFASALDLLQTKYALSIEVGLQRNGSAWRAETRLPFTFANVTSGAETQGYLEFEDIAGWEMLAQLCAQGGARPNGGWGQGGVALRFEIGATHLASGEYAELEAGDWLLIETARLASGTLQVAGRVPGAALTLYATAVGTQLTITEIERTMQGESVVASVDGASNTETLESVMLEIRFDVGEQRCALSELQSIQPGHVFRLDVPIETAPVQLRIGGRLVGRGQLVAVGDQLGVRLVEISAQRG